MKLIAMERFLAMTQLLAGSLDVGDLARRAVRELTLLLEADTSIFFTAADERGVSAAAAGYHVPEALRDPNYTIALSERVPPYVMEALTTGRPVATSDVAHDPRFDHPAIREMPIQARAILYVPLLSKGAVRGAILSYWWHQARVFTDEDLKLAGGIASQVAAAIENAELYAESEHRRRTAETLAELARTLSETLDPERVAERVAHGVRTLMAAKLIVVFRIDPSSGSFIALARSADVPLPIGAGFVLPRGMGTVGLAVAERRPVMTSDLVHDPRITLPDDIRAKVETSDYRAALAVPLIVQERAIGALVIIDSAGTIFRPHDIDIVEAFAAHAAVALQNTRLHEQKVMLAHEDERRRIAYDLHDGIAQLIVGAKHHLDTCLDVRDADSARGRRELEKAAERLGRAIGETRRVLKALAPTALETSGVVDAVRQVLDELARDHEWVVRFNENLGTVRLPTALEAAVFRIVQEALTNVSHHAVASRVDVEIWHEDGELRVLIRDDGRGFQSDGHPDTVGLGLLSMRQRAAALGGVLVIEAPPKQGTLISVRFPFVSV